MKNNARYFCRSRAFTLIELLVVVAIIALLVAILLPALGKAKKLAEASKCLSNLHQIGIMLNCYANDYNGHYAQQGLNRAANSPYVVSWDTGRAPGSPYDGDPAYGLLAVYGMVPRLLACPTLANSGLIPNTNSDAPASPTTYQYYFKSYAWNHMTPSTSTFYGVISVNQVTSPADTLFISDVYSYYKLANRDYNGALWSINPSYGVGGTVGTPNMPTFHGRHSKSGNVLWFDGHASGVPVVFTPSSSVMRLYNDPSVPVPEATMEKDNIGFLARNSSELNSGKPIMDYYFLYDKSYALDTNFSNYRPGGSP